MLMSMLKARGQKITTYLPSLSNKRDFSSDLEVSHNILNTCKNFQLNILLTSSINQFSQFRITKIRHEISVIKTNSFDWELLTFDDIKKIAHFGISSQVLS